MKPAPLAQKEQHVQTAFAGRRQLHRRYFFKTITQRMHIAHLNLFAYSLCREAASWKLNNFESSVDWFLSAFDQI